MQKLLEIMNSKMGGVDLMRKSPDLSYSIYHSGSKVRRVFGAKFNTVFWAVRSITYDIVCSRSYLAFRAELRKKGVCTEYLVLFTI